jgi:hypothetical protein
MLYSKLGSIPKPETDGTEGWIEVPEPPVAPEGKEVIWWYPPGWVVRDIKPADRDGYVWNWSQSQEMWVESEVVSEVITVGGASGAFVFDVGTATTTIDFASAEPTITITPE